jgi:benzoyl-CoA reductase/2-hydroxyglutaryl-CoA dehydratase subunit BcrC/BadD/HgdB
MSSCCTKSNATSKGENPDMAWFKDMPEHCYEYVCAEKQKGRKLVGIMCEFTPREIIMAAGAMPVCLCGGDADMIPAAERDLPANLCPLIKSTYGYSLEKKNPFLEMADLLVAETTCDGKKKMYELLARRHPMFVLELPQKSADPDAFEHWVKELRKLKTDLENQFGVLITDESLRGAIRQMNQERELRRRLAELMKEEAPPLTGGELLELKSLIAGIPADLQHYEQSLASLPGRQAVPDLARRVRVLLTGVPLPHGAERILTLIESHGGLVVCQENCSGLKPILEDVDPEAADPIRAIAEKYFHLPCSVMTRNDRRLESLRTLVREYRADCVVELIWQACLTYDIESVDVRNLVETQMGLPYLKIETDYSPSDSARIILRIQALFETVRNRKP